MYSFFSVEKLLWENNFGVLRRDGEWHGDIEQHGDGPRSTRTGGE
jgi:hypothetical protein